MILEIGGDSMNIAYVPSIAKDQNIGRQLKAFKDYKIDRIRIYQKSLSDKGRPHPALAEMLNCLRPGDTIYIEAFSTLTDNVLELLGIIAALTAKNVGFVSIKEKIDSTTPQGKIYLGAFATLYNFAEECSKEPQNRPLASHRPSGRPKQYAINDSFIAAYQQWKAGAITAVKAMELTNIKKVTFYKLVKEYEAQQAKQAGI
jgi:DNA invertase Pin-like site-specific DNA recombinase